MCVFYQKRPQLQPGLRLRDPILADNPTLCRRLGEAAARDIPVYFWSEIAEKFESYFQSLFLTGLQDFQD